MSVVRSRSRSRQTRASARASGAPGQEWGDLINRQLTLLADVEPGPAGLMKAAFVLGGLASAVGPTWVNLDEEALLRNVVETGRRTLGLRSPRNSRKENWMKTAVVTGGGSGIGQAIATRLGADGYHVAIIDLNSGDDDFAYAADVTDRAQVDAALTEPRNRPGKRFGQCRGRRRVQALHRYLVRRLAAGDQREPARRISLHPGRAAQHDRGRLGTHRQHLLVQHPLGGAVHGALCAAKSTVNGLTRLCPGVRPVRRHRQRGPAGFIDTPMLAPAEGRGLLGEIEKTIEQTPVRRMGRPEASPRHARF